MKKWLSVLLIIFLVLVIVLITAGIYFYNFYTFKTIRICISENSQDTEIPCENNEECLNFFKENIPDFEKIVTSSPDFIKETVQKALIASIICEKTCKIKEVRGININEEIKSCKLSEKEIKLEIKGKQAIEIYKLLKENPNLMKL